MSISKQQENSEMRLTSQHEQVRALYDGIAERYDSEFEGKADYAAPRYVSEIYKDAGIVEGSILDIGCGTGKLREYLGNNFQYEGIDLSSKMLSLAEVRDYTTHTGDALEILHRHGDKSVNHIVALSSLYFMEDFPTLFTEFERVARSSITITLEQFPPETIEMMENRGITIYNHPTSVITTPTKVLSNVYLWTRPGTEQKIYGDVVFKKMK